MFFFLNDADFQRLREKLDCIGQTINLEDRIKNDPVQFVKRFSNPLDIEVAGLVSSCFAYGKVEIIIQTLGKIFNIMGDSPSQFVLEWNNSRMDAFGDIYHRFNNPDDIRTLLWSIGIVLKKWGSLENLFLEGYGKEEENAEIVSVLGNNMKSGISDSISCANQQVCGEVSLEKKSRESSYKKNHRNFKNGLEVFSKEFLKLKTKSPYRNQRKFEYFFPLPSKGSPCKRLCLFARWMVRKDKIDLGIWTKVNPACLVIPLDVHISRIGRYLGFTDRKVSNWKMAEEITDALLRINPEDPLKFDFLLCHLGISGECPTKMDEESCNRCGLREFCGLKKLEHI